VADVDDATSLIHVGVACYFTSYNHCSILMLAAITEKNVRVQLL